MTGPRTIVDSHVHLWENANGWYDLTPESNAGLGGNQPLATTYLVADHLDGAAGVARVSKLVHVSALFDASLALQETRWINDIAEQADIPFAVVGTIDPTRPIDEIESSLDAQMEGGRFRGIRLLAGLDAGTTTGQAILKALAVRGLLYDVVAHPGGGIAEAARAAAAFPDVPFVLEHAGWPLHTDDPAHFSAWKSEMSQFAAVPTATVKLSGLAMTYRRFDADVLAPYFDHCLAEFGSDRCMIGSNFPIDALYGSFSEMFTVYEDLTSSLDDSASEDIFVTTAERVYRL